ncbi:hypothetical protein IWZ01DRAFT_145801 [Phyllosticta capitalensis]
MTRTWLNVPRDLIIHPAQKPTSLLSCSSSLLLFFSLSLSTKHGCWHTFPSFTTSTRCWPHDLYHLQPSAFSNPSIRQSSPPTQPLAHQLCTYSCTQRLSFHPGQPTQVKKNKRKKGPFSTFPTNTKEIITMRANAILVSTTAALMATAPVAALDFYKVAHNAENAVAARAASSYQDNPDSFDADTMPQGYTYSGSSFATPTETPNYKTVAATNTATGESSATATGTAVATPDGGKGSATTPGNANGAATKTPGSATGTPSSNDVNGSSKNGTETATGKDAKTTDASSSNNGTSTLSTKTKTKDSSSKTSDGSSASSTSDSDSSSSSSGSSSSGSSATPSASSTGAAVHAAGVQMGVVSGAVVGVLGWLLAVF